MVIEHGIEAKPKKKKVIEEMNTLACYMEVQFLDD